MSYIETGSGCQDEQASRERGAAVLPEANFSRSWELGIIRQNPYSQRPVWGIRDSQEILISQLKSDFGSKNEMFGSSIQNSAVKRQKLIKIDAFRPWGCYKMILLSWEILISWLKSYFEATSHTFSQKGHRKRI